MLSACFCTGWSLHKIAESMAPNAVRQKGDVVSVSSCYLKKFEPTVRFGFLRNEGVARRLERDGILS